MTVLLATALDGLMLAIAVSDWRRFRVPNLLMALSLILRAATLRRGRRRWWTRRPAP